MKRRTFIQKSSWLGASTIFPSLLLQACSSSEPGNETTESPEVFIEYPVLEVREGEIQMLRRNVSLFKNRGGTIGVLETDEGFVVIDAQFPEYVQPLIDAIGSVEGKPIIALCNTHHHGDHTAGNISFQGLTDRVIAQNLCPVVQQTRAEEQGTLDQQLYATELFESQHSINLGSETIQCHHFGPGHTSNDAIYHFTEANVVHLGDLVFNNVIPVIRANDGANAMGWIERLDTITGMFDNETIFIYGHGDVSVHGNLIDLITMRTFMADASEWVSGQKAAGITLEELKEKHDSFPGHESRLSFWDEHFNDALTGFYDYPLEQIRG